LEATGVTFLSANAQGVGLRGRIVFEPPPRSAPAYPGETSSGLRKGHFLASQQASMVIRRY